jgi:hypothetical protein
MRNNGPFPEHPTLDKLSPNDAFSTIAHLNAVLKRVNPDGYLAKHIEWAKEAVWAAAYPGGHDDSLLNGLEASADQVG